MGSHPRKAVGKFFNYAYSVHWILGKRRGDTTTKRTASAMYEFYLLSTPSFIFTSVNTRSLTFKACR